MQMTVPKKNARKTVLHGIRNALVLAAVVITLPLWLPVRFLACFSEKDDVFRTCSQILSLFPGLLGVFLRRGFYLVCADAFAWDCTIDFGTWLSHRQVKIGRGVYVGGRCTLGTCEIGDHALIGSNVDLLSGRRQHYSDDLSKPISEQGGEYRPVRIGRNTWIGNSAVVMADVGDDAIIGAGSVVVEAIPPGCIAVGNPCTVKKTRSPIAAAEKALSHAD